MDALGDQHFTLTFVLVHRPCTIGKYYVFTTVVL